MSFLNSLFGNKSKTKAASINSTINLVTYAAGLVSDQVSIDTSLDTLRSITSALEMGQAPSADDDERLLAVYLQIEQHLTTNDPIRKYTKDDLRARLSAELRRRLESFETTYKKGE